MSRRLELLVVSVAAGVAAACFVAAGIVAASAGPWFAWLLVSLASILAAGAAGWMAIAGVGNALRAIQDSSERLSEGDLSERAPERGGVGGEFVYVYNTMAERMEHLFDSISAEHARLEAVFDASQDAMIALAADTTVRFMNPAAVRLFDVRMIDAIGRPLIETVRDFELDATVRRAAAGAVQGPAVINFGARRVSLRVTAEPIPDGGDWAVLLMLTDLTEVRRLDQVRRDFLGNVSHELRTPLASIRAMVETLEDTDLEDRATATEFMRRIRQQVERLSSLVNELLDLSRIESGAADLHPEPIDVAAIAAEAASLMAPRSESAHIAIAVPEERGLTIEADRSSVLRIMSNLLDNAIKYGNEASTVDVQVRDEGELVAISVHDQGPGIEEQALPRVFERFYKAEPSRAGEGVGLGLAIVKHLVRAHGGTVDVISPPGQGTTFTVRLPRVFVGRHPGR